MPAFWLTTLILLPKTWILALRFVSVLFLLAEGVVLFFARLGFFLTFGYLFICHTIHLGAFKIKIVVRSPPRLCMRSDDQPCISQPFFLWYLGAFFSSL
jgi:hypothetical protein